MAVVSVRTAFVAVGAGILALWCCCSAPLAAGSEQTSPVESEGFAAPSLSGQVIVDHLAKRKREVERLRKSLQATTAAYEREKNKGKRRTTDIILASFGGLFGGVLAIIAIAYAFHSKLRERETVGYNSALSSVGVEPRGPPPPYSGPSSS